MPAPAMRRAASASTRAAATTRPRPIHEWAEGFIHSLSTSLSVSSVSGQVRATKSASGKKLDSLMVHRIRRAVAGGGVTPQPDARISKALAAGRGVLNLS